MLVERGAVEAAQRPCVLGEVRRHPVHDDADARLVQRVDERPKIVRSAESRCRRVVRRDLIAPRSGERVLGDRQQLDMGKPMLHNVIRQFSGELAVAQPRSPRAEMHLVGAHRLEHRIALRALRHPVGVAPGVVARRHPRRGLRRYLGGEGERVGPLGNRRRRRRARGTCTGRRPGIRARTTPTPRRSPAPASGLRCRSSR